MLYFIYTLVGGKFSDLCIILSFIYDNSTMWELFSWMLFWRHIKYKAVAILVNSLHLLLLSLYVLITSRRNWDKITAFVIIEIYFCLSVNDMKIFVEYCRSRIATR